MAKTQITKYEHIDHHSRVWDAAKTVEIDLNGDVAATTIQFTCRGCKDNINNDVVALTMHRCKD